MSPALDVILAVITTLPPAFDLAGRVRRTIRRKRRDAETRDERPANRGDDE